jgi:biopolymer transport protein ExbB
MVAIAALSCFPTYVYDLHPAPAPGSTGYAYRSDLGFARAHAGAPLTNVPVLLRLRESDARVVYAAMRPDGQDLRFVAGDGITELPYEIESWDPKGTSFVWVRVPVLDDTTTIAMYFGQPDTPTPQHPELVWSEYDAVYHFAGDPGAGSFHDSAEGHDGVPQPNPMTSKNAIDAQIGRGLALFAGDGELVRIDLKTDTASFGVERGGGRTLETWIRPRTAASTGTLFTAEGCCQGWTLRAIPSSVVQGAFGQASCCSFDGGPAPMPDYKEVAGEPSGAGDAWHHLAVSIDRAAGQMSLYIDGASNGALQTTIDTARTLENAETAAIGGGETVGTNSFDGDLDEVRVGKRAFSADWLRVQYLSATDQLVTFPDHPSSAR